MPTCPAEQPVGGDVVNGYAQDHVLVGLGYDEDGRAELGWGATEAAASGVGLDLVRAYDFSDVAQLR